MGKQALITHIDDLSSELCAVAEDLWNNPELGLHEEQSAARLKAVLSAEGFSIESGTGSMPTAFIASYGESNPRIGILGEYDALPGLSQAVRAERDPIEPEGPGHGCGHNLFGTAGIGAAIAIKRAIETGELEGTIEFFGCPAEETLVGKTYMARAGAFDELDAAVTWHPGTLTTPRRGSSNALNSLLFTFEGESAHAAGAPASGRSALDGVELMNIGVEYMREHISDDARVHYAITDGGQAPNVVPAEASVWYFVRAPTRAEVKRNTEWVRDIAEAAATMSQTEVRERFLTGCYDYQANETVTDVIWENMQEIDPVEYSDADRTFARNLQQTIPAERIEQNLDSLPEAVYDTVRDKALYTEPVPAYDEDEQSHGSTEVGDVSWITPTGQFRAATWPLGVPGHSWQVVAANGDFARNGMIYAAKVIAGTVYDLFDNPDILSEAQSEFEEAIGSDSYESPLPAEAQPPFDITSLTP